MNLLLVDHDSSYVTALAVDANSFRQETRFTVCSASCLYIATILLMGRKSKILKTVIGWISILVINFKSFGNGAMDPNPCQSMSLHQNSIQPDNDICTLVSSLYEAPCWISTSVRGLLDPSKLSRFGIVVKEFLQSILANFKPWFDARGSGRNIVGIFRGHISAMARLLESRRRTNGIGTRLFTAHVT